MNEYFKDLSSHRNPLTSVFRQLTNCMFCVIKVIINVLFLSIRQYFYVKNITKGKLMQAVWCKIVSGNSKLTIGLVYRSPNINEEDNTKIKKRHKGS